MRKVLFLTKNDPLKHVIVKNVLSAFSVYSSIMVAQYESLVTLKKIGIKKSQWKVSYHDDPIVFFIFQSLTKRKTYAVFHSLEMYEYQVEIKSLKSFLRFIVFNTFHKYSLKNSRLVIFSNELRRQYYLNKYAWLPVEKTRVMENIPRENSYNYSFQSEEINKGRQFADKFDAVLVIAGAIGDGRNIVEIIEQFKNQNRFGLCVITQSDVVIEDDTSILLFRNLSHETVLSMYQIFNAGLLYYDNWPLNVKFCAPTKMYEYLSSGLYIIGNNNYSLKESGYVDFFFNSTTEIFKALDQIASLPRKKKMKFNFQERFNEVFKEVVQLL